MTDLFNDEENEEKYARQYLYCMEKQWWERSLHLWN